MVITGKQGKNIFIEFLRKNIKKVVDKTQEMLYNNKCLKDMRQKIKNFLRFFLKKLLTDWKISVIIVNVNKKSVR